MSVLTKHDLKHRLSIEEDIAYEVRKIRATLAHSARAIDVITYIRWQGDHVEINEHLFQVSRDLHGPMLGGLACHGETQVVGKESAKGGHLEDADEVCRL